MTRFGWIMLALFAVLGIAVVFLMGSGSSVAPPAADTTDTAVEAVRAPTGLIVPVAGIRPAQLVDSWGDERGGGTRGHQALDIAAPRGTAVLAAAPGRVEKLWQSEAGGITLYVRGDDGFQYYYAHLDRYAPGIGEGVRVRAGQAIAAVGDTGNAGAGNTHLHFGVSEMRPGERWHEGRPLNPYPLLAGGGGGR
jgi:peptidoglycan LD-endopeptidase LytH